VQPNADIRSTVLEWLAASRAQQQGSTEYAKELEDNLRHAYIKQVQHGPVRKWSIKVRSKIVRDEICMRLKVNTLKPKEVRV
jgi:hypothetical protein